jgi:cbb3-type cytochrome oxidase subunit 3
MEWLLWFSKPENTKPVALVIFLLTFIGILLFVYGNRKRGQRLESYGEIPFQDETPKDSASEQHDAKEKS